MKIEPFVGTAEPIRESGAISTIAAAGQLNADMGAQSQAQNWK
jgi:hypothetical protein